MTDATHLAAARNALQNWEIEPNSLQLVSHSENIVYRVDASNGATYVLRLHRPEYHTLSELISEQLWTEALLEYGLDVPVAIKTTTGDRYAQIAIGSETRNVGLLEWVAGEQLRSSLHANSDTTEVRRAFGLLGELMATFHNQATQWVVPMDFKRHAFDQHGLVGLEPFWGRFWEAKELDESERKLLREIQKRVFAILDSFAKTTSNYSLIHADLHLGNVVANGDRLHVIDFDDSGFGWHAYDIAVALSEFSTTDQLPDTLDALVQGYNTQRELDSTTLCWVPLFLFVRKLVSIGWIDNRPELQAYGRAKWLFEQVKEDYESVLVQYS